MFLFFFQAEDGIRDGHVTGVQTCALPILGESDARKAQNIPRPDPTEAFQNPPYSPSAYATHAPPAPNQLPRSAEQYKTQTDNRTPPNGQFPFRTSSSQKISGKTSHDEARSACGSAGTQ